MKGDVTDESRESSIIVLNKTKQKRFFNSYCKEYDKNELGGTEPSKRRQNIIKRRIQTMTEICNANPSFSVLEVGCGTGIYTFEFSKYFKSISGLDISGGMLKEAKKKIKNSSTNNVSFIEGDAENLPFKSFTFDCIMSINTLEHLDDVHKSLEEMKRVVKKKGIIVISFPNPNCKYGTKMVQILKIITPIFNMITRDKSVALTDADAIFHHEITMAQLAKSFDSVGIDIKDKAFMGFIPNEIPSGIATNWLLEKMELILEKIPIICEWGGVIILYGKAI